MEIKPIRPIRNRKTAFCVCFALIATVLMLMIMPFYVNSLLAYCSACNVAIIVFLLMFSYRYIAQSFIYRIRDDFDCVNNLFEVVGYLSWKKKSGKLLFERQLVYLDIAMPYGLWKKTRGKMKNDFSSFEYFDLCPDFCPECSFVFLFNYDDNVSAVRLQIDEPAAVMLIARAGKNKNILKTE